MLSQTQDNIASGVTEKTNIGPEKFKNPEEEKRQENIEGTPLVKTSRTKFLPENDKEMYRNQVTLKPKPKLFNYVLSFF